LDLARPPKRSTHELQRAAGRVQRHASGPAAVGRTSSRRRASGGSPRATRNSRGEGSARPRRLVRQIRAGAAAARRPGLAMASLPRSARPRAASHACPDTRPWAREPLRESSAERAARTATPHHVGPARDRDAARSPWPRSPSSTTIKA
jgi:hypothetical protein